MKLYTLGYGNSELEAFLATTREHGITAVVDVRSRPSSRQPHFNGSALEGALRREGIVYRFMGAELGGIPEEPTVRHSWKQGTLSPSVVSHLRSSAKWDAGIRTLLGVVANPRERVCIICSESNPDECHRKAVALDAAALAPGLEIVHLRVDKASMTEVGLQQVLL